MEVCIPGYEKYSINEFGQVKNIKTGRILKEDIRAGYPSITLSKDNKQKRFVVHRLVATVFIPNRESKPVVNHIDGDKKNNHYLNLEWCSHSHNHKHAYDSGLKSATGSNNGQSKLTEKDIPVIFEMRRTGMKHKDIGSKFGVSRSIIGAILQGKRWSHVKID